MTVTAYSSLSQRGTINDPKAIMLALFKGWIATDPSQSNVFSTSTLGEIIRLSAINSSALVQMSTASLENLFRPYFDEVNVQVQVKDVVEGVDSATRYNLYVFVSVRSSGEKFELSQIITDAFNQGDPLINRILNGEIA